MYFILYGLISGGNCVKSLKKWIFTKQPDCDSLFACNYNAILSWSSLQYSAVLISNNINRNWVTKRIISSLFVPPPPPTTTTNIIMNNKEIHIFLLIIYIIINIFIIQQQQHIFFFHVKKTLNRLVQAIMQAEIWMSECVLRILHL